MIIQQWALKEWAIAVDALLAGELVLLIRKGGIHEPGAHFQVPCDRPLLFPTYEHQSLVALREDYRDRAQAAEAALQPSLGEQILLPGWAEITHQVRLPNHPAAIAALRPFHIWTDTWLMERLAWKPERSAWVLLLRVFRFEQPVSLLPHPTYRGCRSWVPLQPIATSLPDSAPVLSADSYRARVAAVETALAAIAPNSGYSSSLNP